MWSALDFIAFFVSSIMWSALDFIAFRQLLSYSYVLKNSTNRVECHFKDFYYIWIRDSEVAAVSSYEVGESIML